MITKTELAFTLLVVLGMAIHIATAHGNEEFYHAHEGPGGSTCWHSHGPESSLHPDHSLEPCPNEPKPLSVWVQPPPAQAKVLQRDEAHLQGPRIETKVDRTRIDENDVLWISLKDLNKHDFENQAYRCNDGEGNWVHVASSKQFDDARDARNHGLKVVAYIKEPIMPEAWCELRHLTVKD